MDVEFPTNGEVPLPGPESSEHVSSQIALKLMNIAIRIRYCSGIGQRRGVERLSTWILGSVEIQ